MHRSPQQCTELHLEQRRFVETHPNGAPAQERIWFGWETTNRQLVATNIERANDDGASAKCLDHAAIGAILLFFVRHRGATDHQKLGAHKTDAVGTTVGRQLRFFGEIDIGANDHARPVQRDGLTQGECANFFCTPRFGFDATTRIGDIGLGRCDDQRAFTAIENGLLATFQIRYGVTQSHHCGNTQ